MPTTKYHGVPYHVWNQATDMDDFMMYFGVGPEVIVGGEAAYVTNARGARYINGLSGLWNLAAGLGREQLVEAACKQMHELAFSGCWSMVHPRAIELSAKLVEITGGHYQRVMFGCNGSDAVEAAIKMARQYHRQSPNPADRQRYKVFGLKGSYHGFSYGCLSAAGGETNCEKFGPLLPGFIQVDPPYCYRCPNEKPGYPDCELACIKALEETIIAEGPETAAAFIIEPVMGDFNAVAGPDEFYKRLGEICRKYGMLLIADEVTTGFGRTGKLFASQDWDPPADILCLGKAITNGYFPLSATLATEAIYDRFHGKENFFVHGVTHGGHPVACAVSLAAIDIIINEKLPENSSKVGAYLKSGLEELMDRRLQIGDIRGRGLMIAMELVKDRSTKEPLTAKETHAVDIDMAVMGMVLAEHENHLLLYPPLITDEPLADRMVKIIDRCLDRGLMSQLGIKARMVGEFAAAKINP